MDANNVADMIVASVKKSNLNFIIQESPFSLSINLRKSFVKNKNGNIISPPVSSMQNDTEVKEASEILKLKVNKLELENSSLCESLGQLQVELQEARDALHNQGVLLDEANSMALFDIKAFEEKEKLQHELMKKNKEIIRLENKNNNLEEQIKVKKKEKSSLIEEKKNTTIKTEELEQKLTVKESELREAIEEKNKFEKKVTNLLDVLYGCPECGCNACECDISVEGENSEPESPFLPPYDEHTETLSAPPLPPPPSTVYPWTPPLTPPCNSCGGISFGPSPSEVCFKCIPSLQTTTQISRSSPSRTPPGTPPQQ